MSPWEGIAYGKILDSPDILVKVDEYTTNVLRET